MANVVNGKTAADFVVKAMAMVNSHASTETMVEQRARFLEALTGLRVATVLLHDMLCTPPNQCPFDEVENLSRQLIETIQGVTRQNMPSVREIH